MGIQKEITTIKQNIKYARHKFGYGAGNNDDDKLIYDSLAKIEESIKKLQEEYTKQKRTS